LFPILVSSGTINEVAVTDIPVPTNKD
jgi:hypothetical protein